MGKYANDLYIKLSKAIYSLFSPGIQNVTNVKQLIPLGLGYGPAGAVNREKKEISRKAKYGKEEWM